MAELIYGLCALVAALCTFLLVRSWGASRYRLLLWTGLCFAGLTATNVLLFFDKIIFPDFDLTVPRILTTLTAMGVLLYGLVWDAQ